MLFKPVQLGREALERDVLVQDRKSCKRFGPCGVGEKALYLSSFYRSCRYYLPYGGITRVFKRVAMSKGGYSHKGVFASIPYLVVEYDSDAVHGDSRAADRDARKRTLYAARGIVPENAFKYSIIADMAVLNRMPSMRSVTSETN